jgi:hypothetical protein
VKSSLIAEIETILRRGFDRIIKELGMERLAFPLHDWIYTMAKKVDLQNYTMFKAITLKEGSELVGALAGASPEDQEVFREIAERCSLVHPWKFTYARCLTTTSHPMRRWTVYLRKYFISQRTFQVSMYINSSH